MILLFFEVSKILLDKSTEAVRQAKMVLGVVSHRVNLPSKGRWWLVGSAMAQLASPKAYPRCPGFQPIKNLPPYTHSMEEDSFLGFL